MRSQVTWMRLDANGMHHAVVGGEAVCNRVKRWKIERDRLVPAKKEINQRCRVCEEVLAGVLPGGDVEGFVRAALEGVRKAKRHENLWLWDQVQKVTIGLGKLPAKMVGSENVTLWAPDDREDLCLSLSEEEDPIDVVVASLRVPVRGENDLVDHGVLKSVDGRTELTFCDAASFRRSVFRIFRLGCTGRRVLDMFEACKKRRRKGAS